MKDKTHHLKHVQKKIVQSNRKETYLENPSKFKENPEKMSRENLRASGERKRSTRRRALRRPKKR